MGQEGPSTRKWFVIINGTEKFHHLEYFLPLLTHLFSQADEYHQWLSRNGQEYV